MTISFVRLTSNSADTSSTTITSTFAANTAGGLAVIGVYYVDGGTISVSSVTDDNGNTWAPAAAETYNATQGFSERLYYAYNLVGDAGTVTITATFSAATTFRRIHGAEYSSSFGAWTADPLSTTGTGTGNGTALATGTITPARNNAMICCAGSNPGGNISAGASFTLRSPSGGGASTGFADHIQTTLTAETAKLTSSGSGQWGITGATFLDAGWISPAAISATTTFPAATKSGGATVTPAAILASTTMSAPTVTADTGMPAPAAILATTTFPAATVSGGASVSPAGILATTSFGSAEVSVVTPPPFEGFIEFAFGADPDSDLSLLAEEDWTDVTEYVRYSQAISIRAGRHGLGSGTDPVQLRLRLDNRDGRFTPGRNTGDYWPNIRRMVPIRVRVAANGGSPVELCTAFVDTWELGWDESTNDCVMDITANGRLWQIAKRSVAGTSVGRSVAASNPVAYWPLTDVTGATQAASALPSGSPMVKSGSLKFGTGEGMPGQPNILYLGALKNTIGSLTAPIPAGTSSTSWRVEFQLNWFDLDPTDDALGPQWDTAGTIASWRIYYRHSDGTVTLRYSPSDGAEVELDTTVTDPYDGTTRTWRVTADQDGTGIDVVVTVNGTSVLSTTVAAQTMGRPVKARLRSSFFFVSGYDGSQAPAVGHYTFWAPYEAVSTDTELASTGYAEELAADRVARLCEEAGVPVTVIDGDSTAMGIQGDGTLLELLRECEAADGGILHDVGPSGSLVYIPRQYRYNRGVDMTVDVDLRHLSPGFRPTLDGRDLVTSMTVNVAGGSSGTYTAESDEGDQRRSLTLNLAESEDPTAHAAWRVGLGSTGAMRYPRVELDFRRSTDLLDIWLDRGGIDLRLDVTNLPQQHDPLPVHQFSEGYELRLSPHLFRAVLDCVPADPYEVIVLDTSASTLSASVDADDTSWTSIVSRPPRWTTTDEPLLLQCDGETPIVATTIVDVPIAYVSGNTVAHANNGGSLSPSLPASMVAGDLILLYAAIRDAAATVDVPTGYTRLVGWHNAALLGKIHTGSESAPTVTFTGGGANDTTSCAMFALRNTVSDIDNVLVDWTDYNNNPSSSVVEIPPLTTQRMWDGCILFYFVAQSESWTSLATLSGFTEVLDSASALGDNQSVAAGYQIQTTATEVVKTNLTITGGASAVSRTLIAAFAPGVSTLTVTRATNGTAISHSAGESIQVAETGNLGL